MNEINANERRAKRRMKTIKTGTIIYQNGYCTMPCTVVDLSESGAKIKPADALRVPDSFRLTVTNGQSYACELVRRALNHLGVRFT
jgi:PilZ domain